jgi:type IV fimbrial biogenesis protein FimT
LSGSRKRRIVRLFGQKPGYIVVDKKMMMICRHRGFSFLEVLVVIAILAIVSAIVAPNIINWRSGIKLRGAINNLKGDFEMAKSRAIRENSWVTINFNPNSLGYQVWLDNGAGGAGVANDGIRNGSEALLRDRGMPSGITIDLAQTGFGTLGDQTRFNSRGHCTAAGSTLLRNDKGESLRLTVSPLGQLTISKES